MKINYQLENFKAFTDTGNIKFSPITVLCGVNSAGKSSIIKSILLAKQSSLSRRSAAAFSMTSQPLIFNGEFTQLGSWTDTITSRDRSKSLKFSWGVEVNSLEYENSIRAAGLAGSRSYPKKNQGNHSVHLSTTVSSNMNLAEEISTQIDQWDLEVNNSKIIIRRECENESHKSNIYNIEIENLKGLLAREYSSIGRYGLYIGETLKALKSEGGRIKLGRVSITATGPFVGEVRPVFDESWAHFFDQVHKVAERYRGVKPGRIPKWISHLKNAARNYRKAIEQDSNAGYRSPTIRAFIFLAIELAEDVARAHAEAKALISPMWRDIRYLGPLRDQPRRYYQFDDTGGADVGVSGEFTVQVLALEKERQLVARQICKASSGGISFTEPQSDSLLTHTNHWLNFMGLPSVTPSSLDQSLYKVEVGSLAVGLVDVGFGVSQVLPIIVECLRAQAGELVILEQPEIHLHPRVQANLADFLLARSHDGVRFLVESHSEYLIKRFCRRKAESLDDEMKDISSIYFIEGKPGEATCRKVIVNDFGEIEEWPIGFFDLNEDMYWTKASLTKRKSNRK